MQYVINFIKKPQGLYCGSHSEVQNATQSLFEQCKLEQIIDHAVIVRKKS